MFLHITLIPLPLHKTGIALAIPSKLDYVRLALPVHKTGIASAISSQLDCIWLALIFHHFLNP